jgi:histone arginine demethylase JMJD6
MTIVCDSTSLDGVSLEELAVDRRSKLAVADFRAEYLARSRPVVVTDALDGWAAVGKWTPAMFAERYPEKIIAFRDGSQLPMRQFIDRVMASSPANPAPYWTNAPVREHFPELLADIDPQLRYFSPNWAARRYLHRGMAASLHRGAAIEIYIGGSGGAFPVLHWDGLSTHAFLMQIHGVKRYWVWPPSETPNLYPNPEVPNTSPIRDIDHPDLKKYPRFAQARGCSFTLSAGELLFVPSRWWHTARMETPSITLSINTVNASNWSNFAEDMTRKATGLARFAKTAYLSSAGMVNELVDVVGGI